MRLPACCLVAAFALAGCSIVEAPRSLRGDKVSSEQLKELVPGTSTTKDVESLLGTPTTKGTFDNRWIYISQTTHTRIARLPGVDQQRVVVLSFDQNGVLKKIEEHGKKDAKNIAMVSGHTPSPGSEASFLQQLLGNVGKFNAGGAGLNNQPAPGGSGAAFGPSNR